MLIEAEKLSVSIGGRPILQSVSLHVDQGQIYGLIGPNGAGKSTTISLVTGLRAAGGGRLSVLGQEPRSAGRELRRQIGVLPEPSGAYGWMSAPEYLGWFASLYGRRLSAADLARRLARVGLEALDARPIGAYSRGMRQRLGLARALVNDPRLLILDEPANGLDPRGRREIHDILLGLSSRQGVGILLCTHLLDDVERLCSRIGVIHHGRTLAEGTRAELLAARQAARRYRLRLLAPPDGAALPLGARVLAKEGEWWRVEIRAGLRPEAVWRAMLGSGWAVGEIHSEAGGLENLYLDLTAVQAAA